jgi:hypothetical protein
MSDLKIYEIDDAIQSALDAIEVDTETGEILNADRLDAVVADARLKVVSTAKYRAMRKATLKGMEEAYKALGARIKAEKKRDEWLAAMQLRAMHSLGDKSIEAPDILVKIGKLPPSVRILDEAQIPAEYVKAKMETSIDKLAIASDLKAGKSVPGAMLVTDGEKIIIR